jgi:hypothetical protein
MSLRDYCRFPEIGERADFLANSLLFGTNNIESNLSIPFGVLFSIWGVAVISSNFDTEFYEEIPSGEEFIAILIEASRLAPEGRRIQISEISTVRAAFQMLFGDSINDWQNVYAIGISEPELHICPGDILKASRRGTCGTPVFWGNKRYGVLTAGHVAPTLGSIVSDVRGNQVGSVVNVLNPAQGAKTGADVSVIELSGRLAQPSSQFMGKTNLSGTSPINVYKNGGITNTNVVGKAGWFYIPAVKGTYSDLYLTGKAVTQGGDSGCAATFALTNDLIGHVVGGCGSYTSLIQDINYQLNAISVTPGFANILI